MPQSPVVAIVQAIGDAKDVPPDELDVTLQEHVDAGAIQRLATHESASWTLSFELPNHTVTVTSNGNVLVDGVREETWS